MTSQAIETLSIRVKSGLVIFCLAALGTHLMACAGKMPHDRRVENKKTPNEIEKVLREETEKLLSFPGVVGTAQGLCQDQPCIKILVKEHSPGLERKIRKHLEGYPIEIEETGTIRPFH